MERTLRDRVSPRCNRGWARRYPILNLGLVLLSCADKPQSVGRTSDDSSDAATSVGQTGHGTDATADASRPATAVCSASTTSDGTPDPATNTLDAAVPIADASPAHAATTSSPEPEDAGGSSLGDASSTSASVVGDAGPEEASAPGDVPGGSPPVVPLEPPSIEEVPPKFDPDTSGKIDITGPYLVLRKLDSGEGEGAIHSVSVLEIDTATEHVAAVASPNNADVAIAPKRDLVYLDGLASNADNEPSLVRLLDDGFVPARPILGYEGQGADLSGWTWSLDGRFAAVRRSTAAASAYVDVIDSASAGLWHSIAVPDVAFLGDWGGYTLHFHAEENAPREQLFSAVPDGSWSYTLPDNSREPKLGRDGTAYYLVPAELGTGQPPMLYEVRPGGEPTLHTLDASVTLNALHAIVSDGQSVIASATIADTESGIYRIYMDERAPELVVAAEVGSPVVYQTNDGQALLIVRGSFTSYILDAMSVTDAVATRITVDTTGLAGIHRTGNHFFYKVAGEPVTSVGFEAGEIAISAIVGTESATAAECLENDATPTPDDRTALGVNGARLALVDLTKPLASVARWIDADEGATLSCPTWSIDGRSLVFTESSADQTRLFRVTWDDDGASAPELILESATPFAPLALR